MLIALSAAATLAASQSLRILFIGNSHTEVNDLPTMVASLLQSDGSGRRVETQRYFEAFLTDAVNDPAACTAAADPKWDVVVLQGAMASSSHKYKYDNTNCATIGNMARKAGSRVLYFVEWPRRGWDESEFQMNVYRPIRNAVPGSELVPVCYAWDAILKKSPNLDLWNVDGNHASPLGTYLAANVFYYYLAGMSRNPSWSLAGIDSRTNTMAHSAARDAIARNAGKKSA